MVNLSTKIALQVDRAIEILRAGGIVAFPTDTVYGLGGDAFNSKVAERIYSAKQRPRSLPLPILLADLTQVAAVTAAIKKVGMVIVQAYMKECMDKTKKEPGENRDDSSPEEAFL